VHVFADANKKFINVFVKAFTKSDATEPQFGKSSYRLKTFHATIGLIQMLLALACHIKVCAIWVRTVLAPGLLGTRKFGHRCLGDGRLGAKQ